MQNSAGIVVCAHKPIGNPHRFSLFVQKISPITFPIIRDVQDLNGLSTERAGLLAKTICF